MDWNETKDMEEERRFKVVKEAAMKERLKDKLKLKKRKADNTNDDPPEVKPLSITDEAVKLQPDANLFVAAVTADLGCDNGPTIPSSARFGHRMTKFKFMKPQLQLRVRDESKVELPAMDRAVQPIRDEMWSGTGPCGQ